VAVAGLERVGLAVPEVAVGPADAEAGLLEDGGAALQRFRAVVRKAKCPMPAALAAVSFRVWCS
jgi:hypothetical protein